MSIILNESLDFRTAFRWSGAWRQTKSTAPQRLGSTKRGGAAVLSGARSAGSFERRTKCVPRLANDLICLIQGSRSAPIWRKRANRPSRKKPGQ
jgi:hypothetical protein